MLIALGSDKSGFFLKESIKKYFVEAGIAFEDLGTQDFENGVPYFSVAKRVAPMVASGKYERAVLICGTGAGMAVVANKFKGVYAVPCESVYAAKMMRSINGANILCMGGWIIGEVMGLEMVKAFLDTEFLEGLEDWRQKFLTNASAEVKKTEDEIYG